MPFPTFSDLPTELRQLIWDLAVPEDVPAVFCPMSRGGKYGIPAMRRRPPFPPSVGVVLPRLMHVNREARCAVLRKIQLRAFDGRVDSVAVVGSRPFRPDIDSVYWYGNNVPCNPYWEGLSHPFGPERYADVRHLAVNHVFTNRGKEYMVRFLLRYCSALKTISIVVPHADYSQAAAVDKPPARTYRLASISSEECKELIIKYHETQEWWGDNEPMNIHRLDAYVETVAKAGLAGVARQIAAKAMTDPLDADLRDAEERVARWEVNVCVIEGYYGMEGWHQVGPKDTVEGSNVFGFGYTVVTRSRPQDG